MVDTGPAPGHSEAEPRLDEVQDELLGLFPGLSRRRFLALGTIGALTAALPGCTQAQINQANAFLNQIRNRPVRRNISTLTPSSPDIVAWKSAVTQMKALPASDCRSWAHQNQIHTNFGGISHRTWFFFPWHRAYLHFFEEIVRGLSGNNQFALPYWNWTQFPQIPAAFWGTGNPLFHPRTATATSTANAGVVGPGPVLALLGLPTFLQFGGTANTRGQLEGMPHNYVHGFVGGDMNAVPTAPLDPLFWAHHNMVEHTWWQWNLTQGHLNPSNTQWTNKVLTGFCNRNGDPVQVTVADTLSYPILKYRYDDLNIGI